MRYFSVFYATGEEQELTAEKARDYLKGMYKDDFVDDIIDNGIGFRLNTPYREIWTKTDDGLVPIAGWYGTVG